MRTPLRHCAQQLEITLQRKRIIWRRLQIRKIFQASEIQSPDLPKLVLDEKMNAKGNLNMYSSSRIMSRNTNNISMHYFHSLTVEIKKRSANYTEYSAKNKCCNCWPLSPNFVEQNTGHRVGRNFYSARYEVVHIETSRQQRHSQWKSVIC